MCGKYGRPMNARRLFWPVTGALLAFLAIVQILSVQQESPIFDEPIELAAGYSYLHTGDFRLNPEHPPLMKLLVTLPLLALRPSFPIESAYWAKPDEYVFGLQFFFGNGARANRFLFAARLVAILLTALLGLAMALWTRSVFGPAAAMLALALYAFDPTLTAHGRYIKNDLPMALWGFLATIAWTSYLARPGLRRLLLAGLALALAAATKFSAVYLPPVFIILYAIHWWQSRDRTSLWRGIGAFLAVNALAVGLVLLLYASISASHGLTTGGVDRRVIHDLLDRNQPAATARMIARGVLHAHPFLEGLVVFLDHNTIGHPAYLFGMHSLKGWWYYFPAAFAVKTPVATLAALGLAAFLVAAALRSTAIRSLSFAWFVVAVPLVVYAAFSLASHLDMGVRHLLPLYPFLFILAAAALTRLPLRHRGVILGVVCAGLAIESLSIYPHYLAFFNIAAGGPAHGAAVLADSNIDWGQDAANLKRWMDAHGVSQICLDYFGTANLELLGIHGQYLAKTWETAQRASLNCFAAISVDSLDELFLQPGSYSWLRALRPVARIGYSIYVYDLRKGK